jgi:hypothetical protein
VWPSDLLFRGYYTAYIGHYLPTFRHNPSAPIFKGKEIQEDLNFITVEDGTDRLYRNIGKESPLYAAYYPRRAHISSTSQRKPEIMKNVTLIFTPWFFFYFYTMGISVVCIPVLKTWCFGSWIGFHLQATGKSHLSSPSELLTRHWAIVTTRAVGGIQVRSLHYRLTRSFYQIKKSCAKVLSAGMKGQRDEDGRRILLCDNTGGGAVRLRLIRFHYVRVHISTGPPFMYVCSWPFVYLFPTCAPDLPERNCCINRGGGDVLKLWINTYYRRVRFFTVPWGWILFRTIDSLLSRPECFN